MWTPAAEISWGAVDRALIGREFARMSTRHALDHRDHEAVDVARMGSYGCHIDAFCVDIDALYDDGLDHLYGACFDLGGYPVSGDEWAVFDLEIEVDTLSASNAESLSPRHAAGHRRDLRRRRGRRHRAHGRGHGRLEAGHARCCGWSAWCATRPTASFLSCSRAVAGFGPETTRASRGSRSAARPRCTGAQSLPTQRASSLRRGVCSASCAQR